MLGDDINTLRHAEGFLVDGITTLPHPEERPQHEAASRRTHDGRPETNSDTNLPGIPDQIRERIKHAFDAAGIEIPFPHLQLLVREQGLREITRPLAA